MIRHHSQSLGWLEMKQVLFQNLLHVEFHQKDDFTPNQNFFKLV